MVIRPDVVQRLFYTDATSSENIQMHCHVRRMSPTRDWDFSEMVYTEQSLARATHDDGTTG